MVSCLGGDGGRTSPLPCGTMFPLTSLMQDTWQSDMCWIKSSPKIARYSNGSDPSDHQSNMCLKLWFKWRWMAAIQPRFWRLTWRHVSSWGSLAQDRTGEIGGERGLASWAMIPPISRDQTAQISSRNGQSAFFARNFLQTMFFFPGILTFGRTVKKLRGFEGRS